MRRIVLVILVMAGTLLACGDDGAPDRSLAILRTSPIAQESQDALLEELAAEGWKIGENLTLLDPDPTEVYEDEQDAAEAVRGWIEDGADLIVALSTRSAVVAKDAAGTVPVLVLTNDPVASGIVDNPRSPEGNVTGVAFRVPFDRTLDLARQMSDTVEIIGVLWPSDDPAAEPIVAGLKKAAESLGVDLVAESFVGSDEVAAAVDRLVAAGADTVVLANASATVRAFPAIEKATTDAMLPVVGSIASNPFATVILAPDLIETYRQLGRQAVRVLRGTDIADIPVEEPGVFELIVRTEMAARLGIELSDELLAQADEVSD